MTLLKILAVEPTPFFIQSPDQSLQQQALLRVANAGDAGEVSWSLAAPVKQTAQSLGWLEPGTTDHKILLPDLAEPAVMRLILSAGDIQQDEMEILWQPQKRKFLS